ncbi:MAG: FAD-dependent oxidoreductase [Deltaproteobacteria bacterium]|nr:FAD-dependent oxidoreductase [Deltaproteobacteria bacterium]
MVISVERVILTVGIVGNIEDIGIENTGVAVDRSHVVFDEWLRTGKPGVYAIGDLVGPPWLAHRASHEGVICVERIAGWRLLRNQEAFASPVHCGTRSEPSWLFRLLISATSR